jgi:hypothetical protein
LEQDAKKAIADEQARWSPQLRFRQSQTPLVDVELPERKGWRGRPRAVAGLAANMVEAFERIALLERRVSELQERVNALENGQTLSVQVSGAAAWYAGVPYPNPQLHRGHQYQFDKTRSTVGPFLQYLLGRIMFECEARQVRQVDVKVDGGVTLQGLRSLEDLGAITLG